MAVTKVIIQNSGDKTFHYAHAVGEGAPAAGDAIVTDIKHFPLGSEYIDKTNKKFYVRLAEAKAVADWVELTAAQ